jgi:hypothetical protein
MEKVQNLKSSKDKDKLEKFGLYLNMFQERWKRAVIKQDD